MSDEQAETPIATAFRAELQSVLSAPFGNIGDGTAGAAAMRGFGEHAAAVLGMLR